MSISSKKLRPHSTLSTATKSNIPHQPPTIYLQIDTQTHSFSLKVFKHSPACRIRGVTISTVPTVTSIAPANQRRPSIGRMH